MNGYEKRTADKKAAIIEAARKLFARRGVQNVSISEIAKQASVSQVSIYNYFGDKNTLAKEAFISFINAAADRFDHILEQDIPFAEKLELIMQGKNNVVSQIALSHFDEKALDDKVLRDIFGEAVKERAAALYRKFIELGKNQGFIDKSIPTGAAINYFMMSMSIVQNPDYIAESNEYKMGMIKLFLYGIIGK
jgi:AcrR family transcriptional regulator